MVKSELVSQQQTRTVDDEILVDERSIYASKNKGSINTVYKMTLPNAWIKKHGFDSDDKTKRRVNVFMDTKGRLILEPQQQE